MQIMPLTMQCIKKTALCKFEMLREFATNLNKHIRGLEQCIGEANKEEKRG